MALVGAHVPKNLLQQGNILSDTNISNENRKMIRLSEQEILGVVEYFTLIKLNKLLIHPKFIILLLSF